MNQSPSDHPWYRRIGPGLITACVVIGPGSIVTSSKIGANHGYSMLWIVVVSVAFMLVYMTMGAKLGAVAKDTPGNLIREKAGRPLAVLLGCSVFFISAAFQSGNNIGVAAAFDTFTDSKSVVAALVVGFNAVALAFLFAFKNLYRLLERLMMAFVAVMLVSFAINLITLRPNPGEMAAGFVPQLDNIMNLDVLALIGTTFVIAAAFYQAYLVRQKGWDERELRSGILDARVGSLIMALITIMLMSTAAAGLYTGQPVALRDPIAVANALEPTFGSRGRVIFSLGLFSAAYSSFLINSMIGGFIAADGFGLGCKPSDLAPRILTAVALICGMVVALAAFLLDFDRTLTIIAAQAVTVVAAPLVAAILFWLTNQRDIMHSQVNSTTAKVFGGLGLALLLVIAGKTALITLPNSVRNYRQKSQQVEPAPTAENETTTNTVAMRSATFKTENK
ncbi:MAG: Nramp family divalent metal transporter [Rubripirellula sp.]|nr:Nramp family divalent metal transporter [Rubripirellula sp.]